MESKFTLGSGIFAAFAGMGTLVVMITDPSSFDDCIYEINYPDGNGNTIKVESKNYAETYFREVEENDAIFLIKTDSLYLIPLEETDTIFFVGDGQTWNMRRVSCD